MTAGRVARVTFALFVVAFMLLPTLVMAVLSFSGDSYLSFPPRSWGVGAYRDVVVGGQWLAPFRRSLFVGASAGLAALVTGTLAAFAIERARFRGRGFVRLLAVAPLLVPSLAYAIALYVVFAELHLLGTRAGLVFAHTILAVPFVVLVVGGALTRVPRELEGAAMSLGAGRGRAWRDVTARLLIPAFLAGFVLAFLTSFDEVVVTSFIAGVGYETVPKQIFDQIRSGVEPSIAAVGMLLTLITGVLLLTVSLVRRRLS
jgi:ABC-type spermidine/putrescine transport system permease subunit II